MLRGVKTLPQPLACVLGDLNLVRPLAAAGIACAVPSNRGAVRFSRLAKRVIEFDDADSPEEIVRRLLAFGATQPERPILYYQADADLLMLNRNRSLLSDQFRFVLAESELVEEMTDKVRWSQLAQRLDLPVPATVPLSLDDERIDLSFPIVIKPASHETEATFGGSRLTKAIAIQSSAELKERLPYLRRTKGGLIAQQLVAGPESCIESYHVYVDSDRRVAGEFTGRKIRTLPREFGSTTALEVVEIPDVRSLGREIVDRLGLFGVAKLDFKRGSDNRLWLLEVNARFTLWHHAGAAAGVNIPALVWADLSGRPRPPTRLRRLRTTWWHPYDLRAGRMWNVPLAASVGFALQANTRSALAWDDPSPLLHAVIDKLMRRTTPSAAQSVTRSQ